MTANEAKAVLKMSAQELIGKDLVDSAFISNLISQRDHSLAAEQSMVSEIEVIKIDRQITIEATHSKVEALNAALNKTADDLQTERVAHNSVKEQLDNALKQLEPFNPEIRKAKAMANLKVAENARIAALAALEEL